MRYFDKDGHERKEVNDQNEGDSISSNDTGGGSSLYSEPNYGGNPTGKSSLQTKINDWWKKLFGQNDSIEQWIDETGNIKWPTNNGAVPGTAKIINFRKGTTFGRYGGIGGKYVTIPGTSPGKLSLSPNTDISIYAEYKVIKNIPGIEKAIVEPWFNEPGLGIQFRLPMSIEELLRGGYIIEINQ